MTNTLRNLSKLFVFTSTIAFSVSAYSAAWLKEGFDWELPTYATTSSNGGMIGEPYSDDAEVPGKVLLVLWKESEPVKGVYNFARLDHTLGNMDGKPALIRLEVNSKCHAPDWVTAPHSVTQNFQFWKPEYVEQLHGFINAFAERYKNNPQVIGVHMGISDGEYYEHGNLTECPTIDAHDTPDQTYGKLVYGGGREGWGEFSWSSEEEAIYEQEGLTPENFESSVTNIIDLYLDAFGELNAGKLAWMGYAPFGTDKYKASVQNVFSYAQSKNLGNREGQIESWMRYTGNVNGVDLVTGVDNGDDSCSMTFNERFAYSIQGRYWGDENEFYGENAYITDSVGPLHNQAYRFYVSSMRALQLRKNYISVNLDGHHYLRGLENKYEYEYTPGASVDDASLKTQFNPKSFITYLTKTLGRSQEDTPDAFIVLGEKTIKTTSGLYPEEYKDNVKNQSCLEKANENGYALVSDFGRWLSIVSKTDADPSMKKLMPESEKHWGQIISASRTIDDEKVNYELYARKAHEIYLDINNELIQKRCSGTCNIQIKVVFKDDRIMKLQAVPTNGIASEILTTSGGGETRTATFELTDFAGGGTKPDFHIKTDDGTDLSVLMIRVNFLGTESSLPDVPVGISPSGDIPVGLSPNSGIPADGIIFSWEPVDGADEYIVSYNNAGSYTAGVYKNASELDCASGTCQQTISALEQGDGEWWVRSKNDVGESNWSRGLDFKVLPPPPSIPDRPTAISPTDGTAAPDVEFTWEHVPDALEYIISYNNAGQYSVGVYKDAAELDCESGICKQTLSGLDDGYTIWWVRAKNTAGESNWSQYKSVEIVTPPIIPNKPTIIAPKDGALTSPDVTFTWQHVPEAMEYIVSYSTAGNYVPGSYTAASELGCDSGTCELIIPDLDEGNTYWWVRAKNTAGESGWSIYGNFVVGP